MLNHSITLSVIIPLYNKSGTIESCIRSVLAQTKTPDEIIIVDDGSTDNSVDIAKSVLKSHVSHYKIVSQSNMGVSSARNRGAMLATSEYLAFLDADDEWLPIFCEKMCDLIKSFPDGVLFSCRHKIQDYETGAYTAALNITSGFRGYIKDFFDASKKDSIVNSSKCIVGRQTFLSSGGFPINASAGEDLFLWIDLALRGPIVFHDFIGCVVNRFPDASRHGRRGSIPYPLTYYSQNKVEAERLPASAKNFLWRIARNNVIISLMRGDQLEAKLRLETARQIFPIRSMLLVIAFHIPINLMIAVRILRRRIFSQRYFSVLKNCPEDTHKNS